MLAAGPRTERAWISRFRAGTSTRKRDTVTVEEPLEIRVQWSDAGREETRNVSVTMRTPGDDFELAAGFLFSEGLLATREDVHEIAYCQGTGATEFNVVTVRLRSGVTFDPELLNRNFYTTSSCGVCGKGSLEAVEIRGAEPFMPPGNAGDTEAAEKVASDLLASLPDRLSESQPVFHRTGGLHAAGLFTPAGELEILREDVGRHNAVDKVVGRAFLDGTLPLSRRILVVSGRTSFEIMQKALAAGIPFVASVGAPSSLAIDVARRFRMTLAGFVRDGGFNVYTEPSRVSALDGASTTYTDDRVETNAR